MNNYQDEYFNEKIFDTDYAAIANAINAIYKPINIIEFGCGPGNLAKEFCKLGIAVTDIDGFSNPDFKAFLTVDFNKINLNDDNALTEFLKGKSFDMAICTEVAEHLHPDSSIHLVKHLTNCAPLVIFSAAVPGQNGYGHINCRSREFWHKLFVENDFQLVDSIRSELRENEAVAIWYRLNLLDYVHKDSRNINWGKTIENLIGSESNSSSLFYSVNNENIKNIAYLNYPLVKQYFQIRNYLKMHLKKQWMFQLLFPLTIGCGVCPGLLKVASGQIVKRR